MKKITLFEEHQAPEFTEEQKKENLRLAIKALRENPKKAKNIMQDNEGGRCCLCVMAHVAEDICGLERGSLCGIHLPRFDLDKVFYIPEKNRDADNIRLNDMRTASNYNDGVTGIPELTHIEIADKMEQEFLNN